MYMVFLIWNLNTASCRYFRHESETEEEDGDKPAVSYEDMLRTKYPDAYEKLQKEELGFLNESWRK